MARASYAVGIIRQRTLDIRGQTAVMLIISAAGAAAPTFTSPVHIPVESTFPKSKSALLAEKIACMVMDLPDHPDGIV
jgi:hypothetical protein